MYGTDFDRAMQLIEQLDEEMKGAGGEVDIEGVDPERIERFVVAASYLSALLTQAVGSVFKDASVSIAVEPAAAVRAR